MPIVLSAPPSPPRPTADASKIKTANKRTYILQLWLIYPVWTSPRWNVFYRRPSINCDKRANSGGAGKVSPTRLCQSQITTTVKCFFHNFLISKSFSRMQAKQAPPTSRLPILMPLPSCRLAELHPPALTQQHWVACDAVISNTSDGDPGLDPLSSPEKGPRRRWLQGYE